MYIVGTSGHIDHGKTSLIMALTGTDCDRLPEEKARAMTIDIGFASIDFPRFGTVSIIDVPGHERFIRNMVVGAWGIDLALLVVAADDGWMPQTEDHFGVLELLGIERIIPVINKIDMVDAETVEIVEQEIEERLAQTPYAGSLPVKVSARTMEGIDLLKERILESLRQLPKISDAKKPYLFVDRVFKSKGYGTVVTGTLKNGAFHENDAVKVLPSEGEARIKRIESHFSERKEGAPSQRTALNLSGVNTDDLSRGHIIYKGSFFTGSSDIIASVQVRSGRKLKNNSGIEVLIGTASIKGKLIIFAETEQQPGTRFPVRIKFDAPWFFYPGQPFIITSPGGYRIVGGGRVLLPSFGRELPNRRLKSILGLFSTYSRNEIIRFIVTASRFIRRDHLSALFPDTEKSIDKISHEIIEAGHLTERGEFIIDPVWYGDLTASILEAISSSSGLNMKELSDKVKADSEIVKLALTDISAGHPVIEKEGRFFSGDSVTEDALNDEKKALLKTALTNRFEGIEIERITDDRQKREIKDLIKLGFLISLDGSIIYHYGVYHELKEKVLALFGGLPKITVPEAKDATGLSRKYILPLLNRMEKDGLIKRLGDFRIKV